MIIKKHNNKSSLKYLKFRLKKIFDVFNKKSKLKFLVKSIIYSTFVLNIVLIISVGIFLNSNNYYAIKIVNKLDELSNLNIKHLPEIFSYKIKSFFFYPESINIDITHKNYQKIEFERQNAISGSNGKYNVNTNFSYVPASITHGVNKYKIKLRLKGGRNIHFNEQDKASYRIQIKRDETLFGMKTFSIHKPRARNYIEEFVFLEMMNDEGIVTPRYEFVNVTINGKNNGVYAIEEHYTKYLIENNKHKDGPIIAFDNIIGYGLDNIKVYDEKKWLKSSDSIYVKKAISLLKGFRNNTLAIKDVFDESKLAKFFAIADLNYAVHGTIWKSLRFYYNPVSTKLEPIPYDGHRGSVVKGNFLSSEIALSENEVWAYGSNWNWFRTFFNDMDSYSDEFYQEYIHTLERISNKKYLDNFFKKHEEKISNVLKLIYSEFPLIDKIFFYGPAFYYFDRDSYYDAQKNILNKLAATNIDARVTRKSDNSLTISVINKHSSLPYEILYILENENKIHCKPENKVIIVADSPLLDNSRKSIEITFSCDNLQDYNLEDNLELYFKYPGSEKIHSVEVSSWNMISPNSIKNDITRRFPNAKDFDFVEFNDSKQEIVIPSGSYTLSKDLIIPEGYTFIIEKNTTINFINNSVFFSYSKCQWIGTKDNPISFFSENGNNGTIVVYDKNNNLSSSKISYVNFKNLSYPKIKDWNISGSVNFYNGKVKMNNVHISNNESEDALNLISTNYNLKNIHFKSTKSDALDIDFGNGTITDSTFTDIGNDAIDVSGTELLIENIITINVGDKSISAGENSFIKGNNIKIDNAEIGIASKDGSDVTLNEIEISNSKLGLTSFVKKSEYSNASLVINDLILDNVYKNHLVENNSFLKINGAVISNDISNVKSLFYGNEFGIKTQKD